MGLNYVLMNYLAVLISIIAIFAWYLYYMMNIYLAMLIFQIVYCFVDGTIFVCLWKCNCFSGGVGTYRKCKLYHTAIIIDLVINIVIVIIIFLVILLYYLFTPLTSLFFVVMNLHLFVLKGILLCVCKVNQVEKITDMSMIN